MTYPPRHITTLHNTINVLQLSDLHLIFSPQEEASDIDNDVDISYAESLDRCLSQALAQDMPCDLIVVTGDLVSTIERTLYDKIFSILTRTGIPFVCIAGNHDVTDEINTHLPFEERSLIAYSPDTRLLNRHVVDINAGDNGHNHWRLLLLNSGVPGAVYGEISTADFKWLSEQLAQSECPLIIAMHHHVLPVGSAWIDRHILQNAAEFWQLVGQYKTVKAVVTGHVHQQFQSQYKHVNVYTAPATCYQFKPNQDKFALDTHVHAGYRWLQLHPDGLINSWIERL